MDYSYTIFIFHVGAAIWQRTARFMAAVTSKMRDTHQVTVRREFTFKAVSEGVMEFDALSVWLVV